MPTDMPQRCKNRAHLRPPRAPLARAARRRRHRTMHPAARPGPCRRRSSLKSPDRRVPLAQFVFTTLASRMIDRCQCQFAEWFILFAYRVGRVGHAACTMARAQCNGREAASFFHTGPTFLVRLEYISQFMPYYSDCVFSFNFLSVIHFS